MVVYYRLKDPNQFIDPNEAIEAMYWLDEDYPIYRTYNGSAGCFVMDVKTMLTNGMPFTLVEAKLVQQ